MLAYAFVNLSLLTVTCVHLHRTSRAALGLYRLQQWHFVVRKEINRICCLHGCYDYGRSVPVGVKLVEWQRAQEVCKHIRLMVAEAVSLRRVCTMVTKAY